MDIEVESTGLARGALPDSCALVIFGASGDLAHRKLFPALYSLHRQRLLPERLAILGFALATWVDDGFDTAFGIEGLPGAYEWLLLDEM
jgi:glucose-6-phosphate 1-dehydrogenase